MPTMTHPSDSPVSSGEDPAAVRKDSGSRLAAKGVGTAVITLVYRDGLGAIFESAYLGPARRLPALGVQPHIVAMTPIGDWLRPRLRRLWTERFAVVNAAVPGGLTRLPVPPSRMPNAWDEAKLLASWIQRHHGAEQPVIIHAGGTLAANVALHTRKHLPHAKIVFQCWGPTSAEFLYGHVGHEDNHAPPAIAAEADQIEEMDRASFREVDAIVSIGESMTRHLTEHYQVPVEKTLLVPCCVDVATFTAAQTERQRVRQQLGLEDRFVVAFVGSLHRWQEPGGVLHLFELIRELEPQAHLLALTPSPSQLRQQLDEHHIAATHSTVMQVPHSEVPAYLNASDIGLLGRGLLQKPSLVNAISSPIKYGEYLASGCPVILGEGVGDFSELTKTQRVGVVIPHNAIDDEMRSLLKSFFADAHNKSDKLRERCRRVATENLDASQYDERLVQLYAKLVTGSSDCMSEQSQTS